MFSAAGSPCSAAFWRCAKLDVCSTGREGTGDELAALGGCDEASTVCARRCPRARTLSRAIRKPSAKAMVAAAQIRMIKCERGSRIPPWPGSSELYSCLTPALEAKRTLPGEEVDEAVLAAVVVTRSSERDL